jgi:hypothetical protein
MIRAVRRAQPGMTKYIQEYLELKKFWNVTPYIETLLGDRFTKYLC